MMLSKFIISAVLGIAMALAGCQLPRFGGSLPDKRPLGADLDVYAPSGADTAALFDEIPTADTKVDLSEPTGELTLRRALSLALGKSPELADFAWAVRQEEAEGLQASLLPNPEFETEFENFGGSGAFNGVRSLETTIALSQLVELGGKRAKRIRLARAGGKLAGWRYEAKRLEVFTDVTQRFIAALAIQKKLELAREDLKLASTGLDAVTKELAAGKVTMVEKTKASVEVATGKIRVARVERTLNIAKSQLASAWGARKARFTSLAGRLDQIAPIPAADDIVADLDQNPELASWSTEIQERTAALALARAQAIPDVTATVGYRHMRDPGGNDNAIVAGVAIPIPVFDRNQGAIRKARYALSRAKAQQHAAEANLHAKFEKAYQTLASARSEAVALRDEVLPASRDAHQASARSFQEGKGRYIDVLDAQRTLVEVREQYLEALEAHHSALAGVEGIIARPLQSAGSTRGETKQTKGNDNVKS